MSIYRFYRIWFLFVNDRDSFRRKRQKFNNSPKAIVLRHIQAEAKNSEYFSKITLIYYNFGAYLGMD
ncbi:proto-oncogene c-Rel-like isoform X6 [Vespula squamosa]|uniref:Proto-oncogene c-Rel-like isoform X6 n=1 Tax=Vespula squamosa TaxID=30214 RepID=A0ABD2BLS7_VESSQ